MPIRIFPASVDGLGLRGGGHSYPSSWDQEVHLKDITENKGAEKVLGALANERQKLATITELTGAGIWEWCIRTGETWVNEQWIRLLGYSIGDLNLSDMNTWLALFEPDDLKRSNRFLKAHFAGKAPYYKCELRMRHKASHWVWFEFRGKVVQWSENGKPFLMSGTHLDISERKLAEMALRENEEKYRRFLSDLYDGAYETDDKGNLTYINRAAAEIAQKSEKDLLGKPFLPLFTDVSQVVAHNVYQSSLKGEDTGTFELQFKNGTICQFKNAQVKDKAGNITGVFGIMRDISELKHYENALLRRDAILQAVTFEAEALIGSHVLGKKIVKEILARLGKAAAVSRVYIFENRVGDDGVFMRRQRCEWTAPGVAPQNDPLHLEFVPYQVSGFGRWEYMLGQGSIIKGDVKKFPRSEQGRLSQQDIKSLLVVPVFANNIWWGFMGFDDCVKEREWLPMEVDALQTAASLLGLAIERQRAAEQITASLREKEVLIREIHHRVKNNMQVTASLLKLQVRQLNDPKLVEVFKESENRIKTMALVHDKLYQSMDLANIRFKEYIEDLVRHQLISYGINKTDVSVHIQIPDIFLGIDIATPCGMIINELLTNSLKYAFPWGRKGEITLAFRVPHNGVFELLITDNGIGLPKEIDLSRTTSFGLHMVRLLAESQLDGTIELLTNGGTGYRIRFEMPTYSM